jgi:hypothetical protein
MWRLVWCCGELSKSTLHQKFALARLGRHFRASCIDRTYNSHRTSDNNCTFPTMASLARTARRSLQSLRHLTTTQSARITTISHTLDTTAIPEPLLQSAHRIPPASVKKATTTYTPAGKPSGTKASPHARSDIVTSHLTPSIRTLLPLLATQPSHTTSQHTSTGTPTSSPPETPCASLSTCRAYSPATFYA